MVHPTSPHADRLASYPVPPLILGLQSHPCFAARDLSFTVLEAWMTRSRTEGMYHEIMDGAVWKTMKTASGKKFFDPAVDDELCIGL